MSVKIRATGFNLHFHSPRNENYGVIPVQPGMSNHPPEDCIGWVRILDLRNKNKRNAKAFLLFLVRATGFEPAASSSQS